MTDTVTATSEVLIANMALSRISISQRIASFTDQSAAAANCAFWYPNCRNSLLQYAPWDFARTSVRLAVDPTTTFAGWKYCYQYPSNCVHAAAVMTDHGMRVSSTWWCGWFWPNAFNGYAIPKIPFQVIQNSTGTDKCILTDIPCAQLYFIAQTNLVTLYDQMFIDALAWQLAVEIAGPMRADLKYTQLAVKMAKSAKLEAMSQMMNQAQEDPERDSPSVLARW